VDEILWGYSRYFDFRAEPILDTSGKDIHYEVLLRGVYESSGKPRYTDTHPGTYLEQAKIEHTTSSIALDALTYAEENFRTHPWKYHINMYLSDFEDPILVARLATSLARENLVVEIVEELLPDVSEDELLTPYIIRNIKILQWRWIELAIDDYNTLWDNQYNHSVEILEALTQAGIQVQEVKFDGQFVRKLLEKYTLTGQGGEWYREVTEKIQEMKKSGIILVAEWVRDENEIVACGEMGFDMVQWRALLTWAPAREVLH
jgi:EAL domain-containing protein (putative c-di-GMP-specific phosphodiesterase class I)